MLPEAHVRHSIPGRIRLRIPSKKGDPYFFGEMYKQLSLCEGIRRVEVNSMTGSILIIHDVAIETIAAFSRQNNLFTIEEPKRFGVRGRETYLARKISETFRAVNHKVVVSTGGFANIADLLVLALIGLSVYQISKGNFIAPAWYTALWYAMNIFMKSASSRAAE